MGGLTQAIRSPGNPGRFKPSIVSSRPNHGSTPLTVRPVRGRHKSQAPRTYGHLHGQGRRCNLPETAHVLHQRAHQHDKGNPKWRHEQHSRGHGYS